jgi:uncharacterized protein (TIGR02145 family)
MQQMSIMFRCLIVTILVTAFACDGSTREIKAHQLQQRGDGLRYAVNESEPFTGTSVELHENQKMKATVSYRNGKLHGAYLVWNPGGQLVHENHFADGLESGSERQWYDNGQLKSEITRATGTLEGAWIEYYSSGQKDEEGKYAAGKQHGLWVCWFKNGQKKKECNYDAGVLAGSYQAWYENGQLQEAGIYSGGKEEGLWIRWHSNGQKEREGTFSEGVKNPGWSYWTEYGRAYGEVTDVDGNTYLTFQIGDQWWMAEHLKVTHYRNGDPIPNVTDWGAWAALTSGAYCDYQNDIKTFGQYGRLYNWFAVADKRNIAPDGWHVPSNSEWQALANYLSRVDVDPGDRAGFEKLWGCNRNSNGGWAERGAGAIFWISGERDARCAWYRSFSGAGSNSKQSFSGKKAGLLIRCVKD